MFATYPNEDYDRRNEDVDPMAASAEYELEKRVERLDLFPVELEKGTACCQVTFKTQRVCVCVCEGLPKSCLHSDLGLTQRIQSIY